MNYKHFIKGKMQYGADSGFEPLYMPSFLFDYQEFLVRWSVIAGRAAIFTDCGTGKTPMQLVWAQNVVEKTNKPVLILTPLAVSAQTLEEAEKFGIPAERAIPGKINEPKIYITNYEKLHLFNPSDFSGIVCDESSILKNFSGTRRGQITEFMRTIQYRLLCTATAAPNDWQEIGTSSEALGYMGHKDMLDNFFTRRQVHALQNRGRSNEYTIKPHAAKGPFWQWIASWARAARKPSDLGFSDNGFVLPPLTENDIEVKASRPAAGVMFDLEARNFHEEREAIRRTIVERCEMAAERIAQHDGHSIAWCNLNDEGDMLEKLIPGAVQVAGRHSDEHKLEAIQWFKHGTDEKRVVVGKANMLGFGLNLEHCNHMTYFPTHSYEQYYQASRRLWRLFQENPVTIDRIFTNGGRRMLDNMQAKSENASVMFDMLVRHMNDSVDIDTDYEQQTIGVPQWINR